MNKLKLAGLVASLAILGGCSSTAINKNDPGIMSLPEGVDAELLNDSPVVMPANIPTWFISQPRDTEEKIYGAGSSTSTDLQFSMDKALHQAKIVLGDKIASTVSAEIKSYMADNAALSGQTIEETQRVSKSGFKDVDVSKFEVLDKAIYREDDKFRSYILIGLDITPEPEPVVEEADKVTPIDMETAKRIQDAARESLNNL